LSQYNPEEIIILIPAKIAVEKSEIYLPRNPSVIIELSNKIKIIYKTLIRGGRRGKER